MSNSFIKIVFQPQSVYNVSITDFITAISALGTWATVFVGVFVLFMQNRSAKRLVCLQIFNQLAATYDSEAFNLRRANLASQLFYNTDKFNVDDFLLVFYENLALMVKRRLLDSDLTYNIFSFDVICCWYALESFVINMRNEFDDKTLYTEFEWLKDYFLKENAARGIKNTYQTNFNRFLEIEMQRMPKVTCKDISTSSCL